MGGRLTLKNKTRVVFTGDIAFSKYFEKGWKKDALFDIGIEEFLKAADYVVANVECPLTEEGFHRESKLLHACSPEAGAFLKEKNIRIWNLANNHMMDCGAGGIKDTLQAATDNGCQTIGAGKNLEEASEPIIIGADVKVGILSLAKQWSYIQADVDRAGALTWNKVELIRRRIMDLRKTVDWIVLIVHGGDEYSDLSMPYIRRQYQRLLSLGADIIVGHHPHVVQQYEKLDNKLIVYSLGNFVFDTKMQREFKHTERGILLGIDFEKTIYNFDHLATEINREKNSVVVGETPTVFQEMNEVDYTDLWPHAARAFFKVELKRWMLTQKRSKKATILLCIAHIINTCRHERMRTILRGKLSSCCIPRNKVNRQLCKYFEDSKPSKIIGILRSEKK